MTRELVNPCRVRSRTLVVPTVAVGHDGEREVETRVAISRVEATHDHGLWETDSAGWVALWRVLADYEALPSGMTDSEGCRDWPVTAAQASRMAAALGAYLNFEFEGEAAQREELEALVAFLDQAAADQGFLAG